MGGWGRTGLFLALLAKVCGVENPVTYVRENYSPRAVETTDQHRLRQGVRRFRPAALAVLASLEETARSDCCPRSETLQLIAEGGGISLASVRS